MGDGIEKRTLDGVCVLLDVALCDELLRPLQLLLDGLGRFALGLQQELVSKGAVLQARLEVAALEGLNGPS